jgi:hypothetical protein
MRSRLIVRVRPEHRPLLGMQPNQEVVAYPSKVFATAGESKRYRTAQRAAHDAFIQACEGDAGLKAKVLAMGGVPPSENEMGETFLQERLRDHAWMRWDTSKRLEEAKQDDSTTMVVLRGLERQARGHDRVVQDTKAIMLIAEPAPERDVSALLEIWKDKRKPRSWRDDERHLRRFCEFLGKRVDYRRITREQAQAWRNHLEDEGRSHIDVRDHLASLRAMFAVVVGRGDRPDNPFDGVKTLLQAPDASAAAMAKTPTAAEAAKLIETAKAPVFGNGATQLWGKTKRLNEAATLALEGFTYTGARPIEFLQLQRGDVVKVRAVIDGTAVEVVCVHFTDMDANGGWRTKHADKHLKNKKNTALARRWYPLAGDAADFGHRLYAFAQGSKTDFIFDCFGENRSGWFSNNMRALVAKAGVPESITVYGLRHRHRNCMKRVPSDYALQLVGKAGKGTHDNLYRHNTPIAEDFADLYSAVLTIRPLHDAGAAAMVEIVK